MNLIRFTQRPNEDDIGLPVYINPNNITCVAPFAYKNDADKTVYTGNTIITFTSGDEVIVEEDCFLAMTKLTGKE
jgi:hypothetical protein